MTGNYIDFGLALITAGDPYEIDGVKVNDALAKRLAGQLEKRNIKLGKGVLIPFSALKDKDDSSEYYGVTLDLNDSAAKETIRDLRDYRWDYTRNEGLSCVAFDLGRDWVSCDGRLNRTGDIGRVVVVRAEGTAQNFNDEALRGIGRNRGVEDYAVKLQEAREETDALKRRIVNAEHYLRTGKFE